jgi:hypothetical protein
VRGCLATSSLRKPTASRRDAVGQLERQLTSVLTIRILAIGTGKLCVVTTPEGKAVPHPPGRQGTKHQARAGLPVIAGQGSSKQSLRRRLEVTGYG